MGEHITQAFAGMVFCGYQISVERERKRQQEEWAVHLHVIFSALTREEVMSLWDRWDGVNDVDGFGGEEIHGYLNLIGEGRYCAV